MADQELSFFGPTAVRAAARAGDAAGDLEAQAEARGRTSGRRSRSSSFSVDRTKKTDKKAAFKQAFSTASFPRGSVHQVRAVVTLKPVMKGAFKAKKKTLKGRFNVCG